jgi:hypothetical protein
MSEELLNSPKVDLYRHNLSDYKIINGVKIDDKTFVFNNPIDFTSEINRRALDTFIKELKSDPKREEYLHTPFALDNQFNKIKHDIERDDTQAILTVMDNTKNKNRAVEEIKDKTLVITDEAPALKKNLDNAVLLSMPHLSKDEIKGLKLGGKLTENKEKGSVDVKMQKREATLLAVRKLLDSGKADSIEIGKVSDKKLVEALIKLAEEKNVPLKITDPVLQKEFGQHVKKDKDLVPDQKEKALETEKTDKKKIQPGQSLSGDIAYVAPDYDQNGKFREFKIGINVNGETREAIIKPKEELSQTQIESFISDHKGKPRNISVDQNNQAQIRHVIDKGEEIVGEIKSIEGRHAIIYDEKNKREYAENKNNIPEIDQLKEGQKIKLGRNDRGTLELREIDGVPYKSKEIDRNKDKTPER